MKIKIEIKADQAHVEAKEQVQSAIKQNLLRMQKDLDSPLGAIARADFREKIEAERKRLTKLEKENKQVSERLAESMNEVEELDERLQDLRERIEKAEASGDTQIAVKRISPAEVKKIIARIATSNGIDAVLDAGVRSADAGEGVLYLSDRYIDLTDEVIEALTGEK